MNLWMVVGIVVLAAYVLFFRGRASADALMTSAELNKVVGANHSLQLVDVRSPAEFKSGHLAGSVNIPLWNLSGALNQLDQSQPLVVYCRSGHRSALALRTLRSAGFPKAKHLVGGTGAWSRAGFPLES